MHAADRATPPVVSDVESRAWVRRQ